MASTDRLKLYNRALMLLGEPALASLSENRAPRRYLDTAWNGGAVNYCLEAGQWKFAMRSVMLDYSPSVEPGFPGLQYAFDIPDDHVRLGGVFIDESMKEPLLDYREEGGYWWSNYETIYVRYVSNDEDFGGDMSLWSERFCRFVEAHLASEVAMPLTQNQTKFEEMLALRDKKYLVDALNKDAMQEPTKFPPRGSWVRARTDGGGRWRKTGGSR